MSNGKQFKGLPMHYLFTYLNTLVIIGLILSMALLHLDPPTEQRIAVGDYGTYVTANGMFIPIQTLKVDATTYTEICAKHNAVYIPTKQECYIQWLL